MSTKKLLSIRHSCQRFEHNRDVLVAALGRRECRPCLDALVELCGIYLEQTGGTLQTAGYRGELTALRALVAERPVLALVPPSAPTPEKPRPMFEAHEISMPCLACGAPGLIDLNFALEYECRCSQCYDGDPESGLLQAARGTGRTVEAAVADWVDVIEDAIHLALWPVDADWQIALERQRQTGWQRTETAAGILWAPEAEAAQ